MKHLLLFFKTTQSQSQEFLNKVTTTLLPYLPDTKSADYFSFSKNILNNSLNFSRYTDNIKKLLGKMNLELIEPLGKFISKMITVYNNNLIRMDTLLTNLERTRSTFEKVQSDYYRSSYRSKILENYDINSDPLKITKITKNINELLTREKARAANNEQLFAYELKRYNTDIEKLNSEYMELNLLVKEIEESRIFFLKTTMEKYREILKEMETLHKEYNESVTKLFNNETYDKYLNESKEVYSKKLISNNRRFTQENNVTFEEYYQKNKDIIQKEFGFGEENIPNYILKNTEQKLLTVKEQDKKIKEFIKKIIAKEDISYENLSRILDFIRDPNYPEFAKRFLDGILEEYKDKNIKFSSLSNFKHLSHILAYISLSSDSIYSKDFVLNFKIIYLAERLFYQNTKQNNKTYLSAILSTNKLYRTKYFWEDYIELKLVHKLSDYISKFKQISLPEEEKKKKSSLFSKIGNVLGLNVEAKQKSILYNSRIRKLIPNYEQVELDKIQLLDKITTTEITEILKINIPVFSNFNFPSEHALDMIADFAEKYKIHKEIIKYYVTSFNVSIYTIRKTIPDEKNNNITKRTAHKKIKQTDELYKIISCTLQYLGYQDYLNLLTLNKKSYEQLHKKIYKNILNNPKLDIKIRLNIWKVFLKVKELKKTFNYEKLLESSKGNEKIEHDVYIDVERTYVGKTSDTPKRKEQLRNILKAIAVLNNYCQGMNYFAEIILELTDDEQEAFYLFLGVFQHTEYPLIFAKDLLKLRVFFYVFTRIISLFEPEIYNNFVSNNVEVKCFMTQWFITLFLNARQFQKQNEIPLFLLKIIDNFLISGWKSLIKIAVDILHNFEEKILTTEFHDMLQFITSEIVKTDYFTDTNLLTLERALADTKITKKLIKNIEDEYAQSEKIKNIE